MIEFHLDARSGVASHQQIVQQVHRALRLGLLDVGDQLPTVNEVVVALAINPNAVLKAYKVLERLGLVAARPGIGTFVTKTLSDDSLAPHGPLRADLQRWLSTARSAGLDEGNIEELFRDSRPVVHPRGRSATGVLETPSVDWSLGVSQRRTISWTPVIGTIAAVVWIASALRLLEFGRTWFLDLRVYRAAGSALLHHGSPFLSRFTSNHLSFTYPPFALLVLIPLSFGPLSLVECVWWLVNSAALVAMLYLLISSEVSGHTLSGKRRLAIASLLGGAATLVLEPVRSNMDFGQINLLLMLLVVVDLNQSRRKFRGLAIGLAAAVKLTPIVYLLFFAARRDWRSVTQGVATFSALSLIAWLILPGDSALYWFHEATDTGRAGSLGFVSNQSLNGMLHRPPFLGNSLDVVLWVVLCAVVVVLGVLVSSRLASDHRPLVESVLVLALVELLISPISWSHHWSWMAVAPIAAVSLWRDRRWTSVLVIAAIVVSVIAPYWWGIHRGFWGFVADNSLVRGIHLTGLTLLRPFATVELPGGDRGWAGGPARSVG